MHVLIHVNLCPLQAQARISRVKRHLWHTDHHTTLFAYIYIKWKTFFNPVGTRTDCQIWFLNVLLSCSWFTFAFFLNNWTTWCSVYGYDGIWKLQIIFYKQILALKTYPLSQRTQQNNVARGQPSEGIPLHSLILYGSNIIQLVVHHPNHGLHS